MIITKLLQQPIPKSVWYRNDLESVAKACCELSPVSSVTGLGDCIEIHFDPTDMRKYVKNNMKFTIRQTEPLTWRIWRKI